MFITFIATQFPFSRTMRTFSSPCFLLLLFPSISVARMVCNSARLFSFMNKKEYITCSPSYSDGVESGQIAKGIKKEGPLMSEGMQWPDLSVRGWPVGI